MVRACEAQETPFDVRSCRGDDNGAAIFGVLDRGEAYAACSGMYQDMLASTELAERAEGVDCGDEGHRNGRGGGETYLGRDPHHRMSGGDHPAAQRRRREARHPVANREAGYIGSDSADDAGAFETEGRTGEAVDQRLFRQETHAPHHVAEIQARGVHLDCDFAGSWIALFRELPAE